MNERLIANGDTRGCYDSLKELLENHIQLQKKDKLVLLGDYIDRGRKSKEVVDFLIELLQNGYEVIPLMGNHEAMLIDAYENEENISIWIQNGGNETLKSFGIRSLNNIESRYIAFFKDLRYYYSSENYYFVHAGFNDNAINPFTDYYSMLWNSKEYYKNPLLVNKRIIHGHNPITVSKCKERILSRCDVINIDTGCVYKDKEGFGILTAYECHNQRMFFV